MKGQQALTLVLFHYLGSALSQSLVTDGCPACVNVDPILGEIPDDLSGVYNFQGESDECSGGCTYNREDDPETVYCFGPGVRTAKLECAATSITEEGGASESTGMMGMSTNAGQTSSTVDTTGSLGTEIIPSKSLSTSLNSPETSKQDGGSTLATSPSPGVSASEKSTGGETSQSGITQGGSEPTDTTLIENTADGFSFGSSTKSESTEASTPAASTAGDTTPFQSTKGSMLSTSNPTISSTNIPLESTVTLSQTAGDTTPFESTTGSMLPTSNPTISSTNIPLESTVSLSPTITSSIPTTSDAGTSISTTLGCPTGADSLAESCEPGWTQMQQKCYKLETPAIPVTWDIADSGCKSLGSELASIESQCEQNTVFEVANKAAVWIGGNDKNSEGTFTWPSGTEFYKSGAAVLEVYTNLASGFNSASQTTQHCVQLQGSDGEWDDILCSKTLNYVCEKAAYAGAATFVQTTIDTTPLACASTCAFGWTAISCNCYNFQDIAKTWDHATLDCKSLANSQGKTGGLVSITSAELELELLTLSSNQEFWTGGNDKETQKKFVWDLDGTTFYDDGTTTGFNHWYVSGAATQPNNVDGQDCVKFKVKLEDGAVTNAGWDDISCDKTVKFICQYSVL